MFNGVASTEFYKMCRENHLFPLIFQQATQGRQAAHSYLPLTIQVTIKDASNRVIDSVENVLVSWDLSGSVLGTLGKQEGLFVGAGTRDGVLQPGGAHQV